MITTTITSLIAIALLIASHMVWYTFNMIVITYMINNHDHLPDRDRLTDRGSHGVLHTNLIAITYLITNHDFDHLLIAITYLIAGHDLDHLLGRDRLAYRDRLTDRGSLLN